VVGEQTRALAMIEHDQLAARVAVHEQQVRDDELRRRIVGVGRDRADELSCSKRRWNRGHRLDLRCLAGGDRAPPASRCQPATESSPGQV
jgi:hypothetical protein